MNNISPMGELMQADEDEIKINYKWFYILIAGVIIVWCISGLLVSHYAGDNRGIFGDMFGAVNSLFSGLAFATLIFTIYLQTHAIKLQQKELADTREEIRQQKEYLLAQNEVLKTQNFENTFFQLLKLLNEIIDSMKVNDPGYGTFTGRDCFPSFLRSQKQYFRQFSTQGNLSEQDLIEGSYRQTYNTYKKSLGHYFRTLYNLIKFVQQSNVYNKRFYTNLIRAQISDEESVVIFYNCLTSLGREKFKPLIEEFALLKIVAPQMLINPDHFSLYGESAYI